MRYSKYVIHFVTLFFAIPSISFAQDYSAQAKVTILLGSKGQTYTVDRVVDGDTFQLSNGQNLKLASINAPELHDVTKLPKEAKRFGKEIWAYRTIGGKAHEAMEHFLRLGKYQIQLESGTETFDENGNLVAYVYVPLGQLEEGILPDGVIFLEQGDRHGVFLNAYLVKMGFAEVVGAQNEKYHGLLSKLQDEAKANKKGIWES